MNFTKIFLVLVCAGFCAPTMNVPIAGNGLFQTDRIKIIIGSAYASR